MSCDVITSRQNATVKLVCALSRKKTREETGLFRFDGIKLCTEAISKGIAPEYIVVAEGKYGEISERLGECVCDITVVSDEVFGKMSDEKSPEGVITVAKALDKLHKIVTINNKGEFSELPERNERVMLLESIRDPGNLGTVIRTAASLGLDRLVISSDCADVYNPKTIRGAMGALFMQRIDVVEAGELSRYVSALRGTGRRVFGAALHRNAERLGEFAVRRSDCFAVGNEGHGLSDAVLNACDGCALIPMREGCESLNAAMAAGIFIWETSKAVD